MSEKVPGQFNEELWKVYRKSKEYKKSKFLVENDTKLSNSFYAEISNKTKEILNAAVKDNKNKVKNEEALKIANSANIDKDVFRKCYQETI